MKKGNRDGLNKTGKDLSPNDLNKGLFMIVYIAFVTQIIQHYHSHAF